MIKDRILAESLNVYTDIVKWRMAIREYAGAYPARVQDVEIILDRAPLVDKTFRLTIPKINNPVLGELSLRFAGAWINNAVMLWGCRNLYLSSEVYGPLKKVLNTTFAQVIGSMRESYGPSCDIRRIENYSREMRPGKGKINNLGKNAYMGKNIAGIDIGNTTIKIVVIANNQIVYKERLPTFADGKVSLDSIQKSVQKAISLVKAQSRALFSIGVGWFGDVREGKPLLQAADLKRICAYGGESDLISLVNDLRNDREIPTYLFGDSEAIGKSLSVLWPIPNLYLMIFGTSVGGALLDSAERHSDAFGLVARMVVDMSEDAPAHASTGVKGVFQQYVAARGIRGAIEENLGLEEFAWLKGLRINNESSGRLWESWLRSSDRSQNKLAGLIVELIARRLAVGALLIREYFRVDTIGLIGTSLEGPVGPALIASTKKIITQEYGGSDFEIKLAPFDLTYGIAMGAAYSGAAERDRHIGRSEGN